MKKVIASAGLLALGAVGVQNAHGQAELNAGPEKPWSLAGTLRGFYDDNYATAPSGPFKKSSWGFEVRPSASVAFASGPNSLNLSYAYSLRDFTDRPVHKIDQSHDVELFANHNFNERYSLDVGDSFVVAQEPELLSGTGPLSYPLRSEGDNIHNRGMINFRGKLTDLFGFLIGYSNNLYDYSENASNVAVPGSPSLSALLNRIENVVRADTRWHVLEETVLILGYQFEQVGYTKNSESIALNTAAPFISPNTRDNDSHAGYVGVEQTLRSDLSASARVGIQYIDYYNIPSGNAGNGASSTSPFADASLNWRYMEGGSLILGFRHAHNQTDVGAASSTSITEDQESSTVYGTLTQKLTPLSPDLTLTLNGQYQNSTYNGGPFNSETDNIYLVGLNLTYQFCHYLSGEVGYNYDKLESDITGRGYDRNRVYFGVTASY